MNLLYELATTSSNKGGRPRYGYGQDPEQSVPFHLNTDSVL